MYVINETTGEEYYFNLYEKWWHYFLLGFAYFIPHRAYKLTQYPKKRLQDLSNRGIMISLGIGAIGILQDTLYFETSITLEGYIVPYLLIGYMLVVLVTIILWNASHSKKVEINKRKYIDIKINLFSFNTFRTIIWRTMGIIFCVIYPFEIEVYDSAAIGFMICCVGFIAFLMIHYAQKIKHLLENGDIIKFGPIL